MSTITNTSNSYKHGLSAHPLYGVWAGVKRRCYNPNEPAYPYYGGIGITLCDSWLNDPKAFIDWSLANGWRKGMHLDKDILCKEQGISPKVYSPSTCKYIDRKTNIQDALDRDNKGGHCKISNQQVEEIKQRYANGGITQGKLAKEYGISQSHISKMINNKY